MRYRPSESVRVTRTISGSGSSRATATVKDGARLAPLAVTTPSSRPGPAPCVQSGRDDTHAAADRHEREPAVREMARPVRRDERARRPRIRAAVERDGAQLRGRDEIERRAADDEQQRREVDHAVTTRD